MPAPPRASTSSSTRTPQSTRPQASAKGKAKADDHLNLSNQILTAPPSLISFTNLHKLDLSNCGLKEIGFVKEAKLTLTWLNVSGNDLSGTTAWDGVEELGRLFVLNASNCSLKEIPSVVGALYSLKALVITHNSLTELNHIRGLPNLNTLVVSNNSLTSLPASLTTLPALKKISAAHNLLTPTTLPSLAVNSLLKEIKFNDNPLLTSLPSHFSSWGKGSLASLDFKGKRRGGLEIVDLGACGFGDWSGLKELAGQDTIVNLGLKGNAVAEVAKLEGFEEFRRKITILLPSLRILDGQRFDPKFFDLKAKRALRPAEQRIVDSGPMGLAINASAATPVSVVLEVERRRKRKIDAASGIELDEEAERELMEIKRKKVLEKDERRKAFEDKQKKDGVVLELVKAQQKRKEEKSVKRKAVEVDQGDEVEEGKKEKRKKKKSEASTDEVKAREAVAAETVETPVPTIPSEPLIRKRGRKSAHIQTLTMPLLTKTPRTPSNDLNPLKRKKKSAGGVLSALKGTEAEQVAEEKVRKEYVPTGANVVEKIDREGELTEKTSVLKVVEVKKKKSSEKEDSGVGLEGLMSKKVESVGLGGWD